MAKAKGSWNPLVTLASSMQEGARPFYLFHGENQWFMAEAIALLRDAVVREGSEAFGFVSRPLQRTGDWGEAETRLRAFSFFDGPTLVHLEVQAKLPDALRDALSDFLEESPGSNVLCLTTPKVSFLTAAKNRILKAGGLELAFPPLSDVQLLGWTKERLTQKGLESDAAAASYLVESLPKEPGEIASEIEKLSLMLGPGGRVTRKEIERLVGHHRLEDVWHLAAALRPGNEAEAMRRLGELLDSGAQSPVALVPALSWTITMLLRARLLLDSRMSRGQAASALPLWGDRARDYVERAAELSKRDLLAWVFNLQKLDNQLKRIPEDRRRQLVETTFLESMAGRYLRASAP